MDNKRLKFSIGFGLLGALFYIPFLGGVHLFDWDEINFAEISREMMLLKDYFRIHVNFEPFWEKPPFFFWLQVSAMQTFGVGEFAARLPNALFGVANLVLIYNIGYKLYNHRFGAIWALVYFGTVLPFLYFKSGIIDPVFNFFIFLGIYYFILFVWKKEGTSAIRLPKNEWTYLFWGGFFIGMGILTKGQVAFLIAALTIFVYWMTELWQKNRQAFFGLVALFSVAFLGLQWSGIIGTYLFLAGFLLATGLVLVLFYWNTFFVSIPQLIVFTLAATIVTLAWYGIETWKNGTWFIEEFNKYQYRLFSTPDAGHKGFFGYHFAVLLVGCFPASIFTIRSFFKMEGVEQIHQQNFRKWMKILFWVVLILFSIVKSKIVHYSSMCYYPLTFLAAVVIYKILDEDIRFSVWMRVGLFLVGGLFITATVILPIAGQNIELIKPLFQKDPFALANLEAEVRWTGWEVIPGLFLLLVLIGKTILIRRNQALRGFQLLFFGTSLFVMLTLFFFIGRIEGYSQRAAVEFYESKIDEDCYIISHGYKTYAHLFYARKPVVGNNQSYDKNWLLHGYVDKNVYVVAKIHRADELRTIETLDELYAKNGFVFFKRK